MKNKINEKIRAYHYTNSKAYRSMQTKGIDGYFAPGFDNFIGLIPKRRFIRLGSVKLPSEAHDGVIEALLEPEPTSWIRNPEFPGLWNYLMHDVCRDDETMLLSFELTPKDKAFVVDRAHVERELYRESKGQGKSTVKTLNNAFRKYWNSRIPVFNYHGNYSSPQLVIWSGIEFERLEVEWKKPTREFWNQVVEKNGNLI